MKRKIKLRDITAKQWDENKRIECNKGQCCNDCKFGYINCDNSNIKSSWINHKELYSDKFLDQKIEVEVPDILDEVEKEYLSAVIEPFRERVISITQQVILLGPLARITIDLKGLISKSTVSIILPSFQYNSMYKGMEVDKKYTLEELRL